MPISSILDSTTFSTLDAAGRQAVHGLFHDRYLREEKVALDISAIFKKRKALAITLDAYRSQISKINPASFPYLSQTQRKALLRELLFAFYIFSAQYKLDSAEHRWQNQKIYGALIKQCADLINELKKSSKALSPETILTTATDDDYGKHAKYLGLTIVAPFVTERVMELSSTTVKEWKGTGSSNVLIKWMNDINALRLYWVWGGGLLSSTLDMLSEDLGNKLQTRDAMVAHAPITGYMSWVLYYARFGINLGLLLKHTIAGPWMSEEERQIPAWERFKTQWEQRKFSLLNDSIWGMANMVCFFWLTGRGMMGHMGNVVTTALLLMDVCLSTWRFLEESTQHNADMVRYERDIKALREAINKEGIAAEEKEILQLQLSSLLKARHQSEFNWRYKKYGLANDLTYAVCLLTAFALMCCFLFPPAAIAPATALILGIIGASLCFTFTVAYSAATGSLDIAKTHASKQEAKNECKLLLQEFMDSDDEFIKKQLYLDMKQLAADTEYQKRVIQYQKMKLVRSVLIDILIPPLVFVSFMFLPMGIGLGVLAAGLALAGITYLILKQFEPHADKLPVLDEEAYAKFAKLPNPTLDDLIEKKPEQRGFFSEKRKDGYDLVSGEEAVERDVEEDGIELLPLTRKVHSS